MNRVPVGTPTSTPSVSTVGQSDTPPRILIVEDQAIVALDLATRLEEMGYGIVAAVGSKAEAIEQVCEANPDLVLMDIRLRGDDDGIDVATRIREISGAPVIYLTAHSDERTVERAKQTDPFGYVLKPIQEHSLRVAIEVALHKAQSHTAERNEARTVLQRSESKYRELADLLPQVVFEIDRAGFLTFTNQNARSLFGERAEDT